MGLAIMIVGITVLLVGAVWGVRKLSSEDAEGEDDEQAACFSVSKKQKDTRMR